MFPIRLPGTTLNRTVKRILMDRTKVLQKKKLKSKVSDIDKRIKMEKHNPLPVTEQISEQQRIKKDLQLRARPKTKFQVDYTKKLTREERDIMLNAKEYFPTVNERAIELRRLGFDWDLIENRLVHQYTVKLKDKQDLTLKKNLILDQLRQLQLNEQAASATSASTPNTASDSTPSSASDSTPSSATSTSDDATASHGQVRQYSTGPSHALTRRATRQLAGLWPTSARLTRVTARVTGRWSRAYTTRVGLASELTVTAAAAQKVKDLQAEEQNNNIRLRIQVDSGGCSGFEVKFLIEDQPPRADDVVFERDGAQVLVDDISLPLLNGATIDYIDELARNCFAVVANPNASKSCGCGVSFALK